MFFLIIFKPLAWFREKALRTLTLSEARRRNDYLLFVSDFIELAVVERCGIKLASISENPELENIGLMT